MNKRLAAALLASSVASVTSAAILEEPFVYSTGDLATVGTPKWTASTTGTGDAQVVAGALQYTDANPAYGSIIGTPLPNMVELSNQRGKIDRTGTVGYLPVGSGNLFYSLLLKVNDMTNATTGGGFIAGFNNSVGTATTSITQAGARLQLRRDLTDSTKYNVGIRNDVSASTGTSAIGWDTVKHAIGETLFVVVQYEFNLSTNLDDVARIWINPADTDLGAAVAPVANATSTGGDINQLQIQSFFLRQVSGAALPRNVNVDEIHMDGSWQGVTSIPEPASVGLLGVGATALLGRRRRR